VARALFLTLPHKVKFAVPSLYPAGWSDFAALFFRLGGIVEACPSNVLSSPSANLFIEPDGTVSVTSSHDQIFHQPYVFGGATFPSSAPADLLHRVTKALGRVCFTKGIIGYVGVDFVLSYDKRSKLQQLWAVDLNVRMTSTAASFKMFDFLMRGRYHANAIVPRNKLHEANPIRYTVPSNSTQKKKKKSKAESKGVLYRVGEDGDDDDEAEEEEREDRFYCVASYLYQPNLATVRFVPFFNVCRLNRITYDISQRCGSPFMLHDSLASGTLGIMSVHASALQACSEMVRALSFLVKYSGTLHLGATHVQHTESNLQSVLNQFKALLKARLQN
jgi:hypothetical protein